MVTVNGTYLDNDLYNLCRYWMKCHYSVFDHVAYAVIHITGVIFDNRYGFTSHPPKWGDLHDLILVGEEWASRHARNTIVFPTLDGTLKWQYVDENGKIVTV